MNKAHITKSIKYIKGQIDIRESAIEALRADLKVLEEQPPEIPTWNAIVASAWQSEGEPNWRGTIEARTLREAVYEAMLAFCKNAGRIYPGSKRRYGRNLTVWDHFDLQGDIYMSMQLPNGTAIPVDHASLDKLKKEFNKRAPMPKKKPRSEPVGLT